MVAAQHGHFLTAEEYLMREQEAETKSEYDNGVMIAMAGASFEHGVIALNLASALLPHLEKQGCQAVLSDLRVRIEASNCYYYPDIVVVCGDPVYERIKSMESLINPTMVVEILSNSTNRTDRGTKVVDYQTIDTLDAYLIVYQDKPRLEIYTRSSDDRETWASQTLNGLESVSALGGTEVALSVIYRNIKFNKEK